MLRSATFLAIAALALSWAGFPRDATMKERMVPVKMPDGKILKVSPYEVTLADWQKCVREKGCALSPKTPVTQAAPPVTGVNWFDVNEYLAWANKRAGGGLRLPTRDEWRWLNRSLAKPKRDPLFTDPRLAWAADYGQDETPPGPPRVGGSFSTTPDGIADLDGNVWEWTATCAGQVQAGKAAGLCPAYVAAGLHEADIPIFLRNPAQGGCASGTPPAYLGFRLVSDQ